MSIASLGRLFGRPQVLLAVTLGLILVGTQLASPSRGDTGPGDTGPEDTTGASQQVTTTARARHHSWNHHVRCRATVATLRQVLGKVKNRNGGAAYRGGHFKPGIPDRRDFTPPCFQHDVPTFVQINRVKMGSCKQINEDGDWTCNMWDPSVPRNRTEKMSSIHVETDRKFRLRTNWTKPPGGKLLNIQGFVFWDPGHTDADWHHYSGWEIHSLTAWRHSPKR